MGDYDQNQVQRIHDYGKSAIPYLIDLIDTEAKGNPGFVNKYSSTIDLSDKYLGMNAAFLVELILAREKISSPLTYYEGTTMFSQVEGISYGVIVKDDSMHLTKEDMINIKSQYSNWWKKYNEKHLSEIRDIWASGDRPLTFSKFNWR